MTLFDYQGTRNTIIQRALRLCGALSPGDEFTAEFEQTGAQALNEMVQAWQAENIFLWTLARTTLSLAAGTTSYATPTSTPIIGIEQATLTVGNSDQQIKILSYRQYDEIFDKTATGTPSAICLVPTDPPTFNIWPVPSGTGTITYLAVTKQQDFDSATDTGGFPSKWMQALAYGLAGVLCDEFPVPINERLYLNEKAKGFLAGVKKSNREKPTDDFVRGAFRNA